MVGSGDVNLASADCYSPLIVNLDIDSFFLFCSSYMLAVMCNLCAIFAFPVLNCQEVVVVFCSKWHFAGREVQYFVSSVIK